MLLDGAFALRVQVGSASTYGYSKLAAAVGIIESPVPKVQEYSRRNDPENLHFGKCDRKEIVR